MRLDTCSLKDAERLPGTSRHEGSPKIGNVPVTKPAQLWQRILTSARGCRGVSDVRQAGEEVYLFLLPWREDVAHGVEFRVFCAPGGVITAVSQYTWHAPLQLSNAVDLEAWCHKAFENIQGIHREIVAAPAYSDDMVQAGFTFDVLVINDHVQLVELNTFGAMTGCGSCLFHWIDDAKLLYGLQSQVEMRVTR